MTAILIADSERTVNRGMSLVDQELAHLATPGWRYETDPTYYFVPRST